MRLPISLYRRLRWGSGRRQPPLWVYTPTHRRLTSLHWTAHAGGRRSLRRRLQYALSGGALKYRERLYADRMNFGARLCGPVDAEVLRNAALWQRAVTETPPQVPQPHANLHITGNADQIQLDRLMSALLMSQAFSSINLFFDDRAAEAAKLVTLTVAEERRDPKSAEYPLDATHPLSKEWFVTTDWSRIFSLRSGFHQNANHYLKTAHPGIFIIALGLPEDVDGFCDAWLQEWDEAVRESAADFPDTAFVVLNRSGPDVISPFGARGRKAVAFARRAGLSLGETLGLAQRADAFVGMMDLFGLAARAARRPGIYMSTIDPPSVHPDTRIVHTEPLAPREALARLRTLLLAGSSSS